MLITKRLNNRKVKCNRKIASLYLRTAQVLLWYPPTMRSRLVINPVSGSDSGPDYLPLINARLRERVGLMDVVMTVGPGDASLAAADAARHGYHQLFVAGGDGTLNEALNGVASVPGKLAHVTFGILPLGTGNDFARTLGFADDVETALQQMLESEPAAVDVGVLNGRYFLNVSGGGFIAEVSDAVDTELKSIAGKLAYLIGGAQVLLTHEPVMARVRWSDAVRSGTDNLALHAFAVCNAQQIGGGRLIAPEAVIDDGLLDVCLIESMPTVEFVALLRRVSSGDHVDDPRVRYFRAREVELLFERTVKVNTDGQVLDAQRCAYDVLPRAVRVLRPALAS
jgi:diacylglycerol kinase (ATP)